MIQDATAIARLLQAALRGAAQHIRRALVAAVHMMASKALAGQLAQSALGVRTKLDFNFKVA